MRSADDLASPPAAPTGSSEWYIADTGVRYGLVLSASSKTNPDKALGLTNPPLPAPWSIISLLPPGPALSKADALISHDRLPLDDAGVELNSKPAGQ